MQYKINARTYILDIGNTNAYNMTNSVRGYFDINKQAPLPMQHLCEMLK